MLYWRLILKLEIPFLIFTISVLQITINYYHFAENLKISLCIVIILYLDNFSKMNKIVWVLKSRYRKIWEMYTTLYKMSNNVRLMGKIHLQTISF